MKSIILAMVIAFTNYLPTTSNVKEDFGPKIEVSMELGRKSQGCSGFGICKFSSKTSFQVNGTFELRENTSNMGNFEIQRIMITKIPNETAQEHFYVNGKLRSYYSISEGLKSEMEVDGKKATVNLKMGRYKIAKSGSGFTLSR